MARCKYLAKKNESGNKNKKKRIIWIKLSCFSSKLKIYKLRQRVIARNTKYYYCKNNVKTIFLLIKNNKQHLITGENKSK